MNPPLDNHNILLYLGPPMTPEERRIEALTILLKELFINLYDIKRWDAPEVEEYSFRGHKPTMEAGIEKHGVASDFYTYYHQVSNLHRALSIDPELDKDILQPWIEELRERKKEKRRVQLENIKRDKERRSNSIRKKRTISIDDLI